MKKRYDYVEALHRVAEGPGRPTHQAEYRRILRKLVREAVREAWRTGFHHNKPEKLIRRLVEELLP